MNASDLPRIDPLRCGGCGTCVAHCPTQALALHGATAVLTAPERCTRCVACEEICPQGAIAIPFVIRFAAAPVGSPRPARNPGAPGLHLHP